MFCWRFCLINFWSKQTEMNTIDLFYIPSNLECFIYASRNTTFTSKHWWTIHLQCRRPRFSSLVGKIPWRSDRLPIPIFLDFPVAQLVKNPPAMQDTWVWSLGLEDTLEKGKATHSSILIWWESGTMYSPWGWKESDTTEWLSQPLLSNTCHYKNKKIKNKKTSGFFVKKTALMYAQIDSRCLRFSC